MVCHWYTLRGPSNELSFKPHVQENMPSVNGITHRILKSLRGHTDCICHEDKSPHGFAGESETLVNVVSHLWAEVVERASWLHGNPVTTGICSASPVKD